MHMLMAAAMAWAGWAALTPVPIALALSQLPAVVWVLAWLVDLPDRYALAWSPRPAQAAAPPPPAREPLPTLATHPVRLAPVVPLDEHRRRRAA